MIEARPTRFQALRIRSAIAVCFILLMLIGSLSAVNAQDGDDNSGEAIALFNQGQDAHEKGDLPAAVELYEKALKIIPDFPEAELQRGNAFLTMGRSEDAEKAFRHAVKIREDWTLALASLGSVLVQRSNFAEAEPLLTRAIELDNQNFPAYAALAELRLRTDADPAVLAALLKTLTDLSSTARPTASIWAARAALESALGNRTASKQSLARALELDPKNKFALSESANIALAENDPDRAAEHVRKLEALSSSEETVRSLRARILVAHGKSDEAIKLLDSVASPGTAVVKLRAAIVAGTSTDEAALEKELIADPKNSAVLGRLCTVLRTRNPKRALDLCRRASEAEPDNIAHAIGYAAALVQAKEYEKAVFMLRKLLEIAPDNTTVHANLATALFQMERFADARTEYRWLLNRQPELAAAYYFLAISHDKLGEYVDAMANYQQFLRLADPQDSKLEIEKVNLRLPILQKQIKQRKGKRNG